MQALLSANSGPLGLGTEAVMIGDFRADDKDLSRPEAPYCPAVRDEPAAVPRQPKRLAPTKMPPTIRAAGIPEPIAGAGTAHGTALTQAL